MHVNILSYVGGRREVMGVARVRGGHVVFEGQLPPLLLKTFEDGLRDASGLVYPLDGESFLYAMPHAISGSYVRAELVP